MGVHLDRLPTAADGEAGLDKLVELFGARNVFLHIRFMRDHTTKPDIVGITAKLLAASMLRQIMSKDKTVDRDTARLRLAIRLRYADTERTNFYKRLLGPGEIQAEQDKPLRYYPTPRDGGEIDRLPTAADGEAGLRTFIATFGTEAVFQHIRWMRDHRPQAPLVGRFTEKLAVELVRLAMAEDPALDYLAARRKVTDQLGYSTTGRTWFHTILRHGEERAAHNDSTADQYA